MIIFLYTKKPVPEVAIPEPNHPSMNPIALKGY